MLLEDFKKTHGISELPLWPSKSGSGRNVGSVLVDGKEVMAMTSPKFDPEQTAHINLMTTVKGEDGEYVEAEKPYYSIFNKSKPAMVL